MAAGFLLAASVVLPSSGQTTGKIAGTVTDAGTGQTLPGVNVLIAGTTQGTSTDTDGYYYILNLKPGTYSIQASFIGFSLVTVQEVRVQVDKTTVLDIALSEQIIEGEEIVVVATRAAVERDLTSSITSVSSDQLESLPVQSFSDVVNQQAGVVDGHFRGGRVGEVSYMVDGIPINDVYDQTFAFEVELNAIQEVQIISGTFNAEFGQAQSGVVNIVTKDGSQEYKGSVGAYVGDYITGRSDRFQRLDQLSPTDSYEMQGSLGGPVPGLRGRTTFFASGRLLSNEGFLYGQRVVQPVSPVSGQGQTVDVDGRQVFVPALGDSSYAPMNWGDQATGQLKITTRLFGNDRLTANVLVQRDKGQGYDHLFRYNPDGRPTTYGDSWSTTMTYTHVFGTSSFMDVKGAFFRNSVASYLYEDPLDTRYPLDNALRQLAGNFSFYRGGANMSHFERETETWVGRVDFTSQISRQHLVKTGIEYKAHQLFLDDFEVKNNASTGFAPAVPLAGTPDHVLYTKHPVEASAFLQDKMEFDFMVVNAGIRLDYFDPKSEVLEDYGRPKTSSRIPTQVKWQLSPRIGLAYPLSERGVVHVAYGHFFQMPPFEFLFTNPDYIYDPEEGLNRAFGMPDLKPQRTVAYEIGLQQEVSGLVLEATSYFKDIRNLLGSRIEVIKPGFDEAFQLEKYGRFINRDYGQVKGFILTAERLMADGFGLKVDYTFQVAQGNASDPRSVLLDEAAGIESEKQLVPLDWDRRHQLNITLTIGDPGNWLATFTGQAGSGLPYTPSLADERIGLENSGRRRGTSNLDLYAMKNLSLSGFDVSVFTRIFNVLDTQNEQQIYSDTGRAFPNLRFLSGEAQGLNTKDEFLRRPDFYSAPRQITVGITTRF